MLSGKDKTQEKLAGGLVRAATKSLDLLRLRSVPDHEAVDRLENRLRTLACSRRGHDMPPQYRR